LYHLDVLNLVLNECIQDQKACVFQRNSTGSFNDRQENRVLRVIFGPKRNEVTGEWRKLHNEGLNDLYCSPSIIWVMKSRRMRWAGHVACMVETRCMQGFVGESEGDHLQDPGIDGRIIVKCFFKKWDGEVWTGLLWLRVGTVVGLL
jgi:hypothetical protein